MAHIISIDPAPYWKWDHLYCFVCHETATYTVLLMTSEHEWAKLSKKICGSTWIVIFGMNMSNPYWGDVRVAACSAHKEYVSLLLMS